MLSKIDSYTYVTFIYSFIYSFILVIIFKVGFIKDFKGTKQANKF